MAYTTINKPSDYFNTVTYTGNGSTQSITGVGFKPDWVWAKTRVAVSSHKLYDSVRGVSKALYSNGTTAEVNDSPYGVTSFNSDGFSVNDNSNGDYGVNGGSGGTYSGTPPNYVAWNWLASNTTASNTDGSITSTVSASTTSGFSIVSYTGGGSFGDTVGHGLGAVPAMIIIKTTNAISSWYTWQKAMGATDNQFMDFSTAALQTSGATIFDVSAMSSTTFTLGTNTDVNGSGSPKIAYCFAEKKGFSKFGKYTGNGSTDGTFVYTGFKPAFVLVKASSAVGTWHVQDSARNPSNIVNKSIYPNSSSVEETYDVMDFTSNGFKIRTTNTGINANGQTNIYMAFAENPLVTSTKLPATAR